MTAYDEIMSISSSLDKMREQFAPMSGMCDSLNGECLRAFDRVLYRFFNDDDYEDESEFYYNLYGDGYSTVRPSVLWLINEAPTEEIRQAADSLTSKDRFTDDEYEGLLLALAKAMGSIDWSDNRPNTCDSRNYSK